MPDGITPSASYTLTMNPNQNSVRYKFDSGAQGDLSADILSPGPREENSSSGSSDSLMEKAKAWCARFFGGSANESEDTGQSAKNTPVDALHPGDRPPTEEDKIHEAIIRNTYGKPGNAGNKDELPRPPGYVGPNNTILSDPKPGYYWTMGAGQPYQTPLPDGYPADYGSKKYQTDHGLETPT